MTLFGGIFLPLEKPFYSLHPFRSEDGESAILKSLGKSEKDDPEDALGGGTDGQGHLGKREGIEGDAEREDDDTCLEGEEAQPVFDALEKSFHLCLMSYMFLRVQR